MGVTLQRLCLALVLLVAALSRAAAGVDGAPAESPEPPPAPLTTAVEPAESSEPPPAPLLVPAAVPPPPAPPTPAPRGRTSRNAAWAGAAVSLALFTTGTVFGVLAQQRSDSLSRSTTQLIDGLAPVYDAAQHAAYTDLQSQGQLYNNVTIGCFFAGGATALASAILFWNAGQLAARDQTLALVPTVAPGGGTVTLLGSF